MVSKYNILNITLDRNNFCLRVLRKNEPHKVGKTFFLFRFFFLLTNSRNKSSFDTKLFVYNILQFRRVEANVVEIEDPFGPAIVDPTLQGGCNYLRQPPKKTCPSPILLKFVVHISLKMKRWLQKFEVAVTKRPLVRRSSSRVLKISFKIQCHFLLNG